MSANFGKRGVDDPMTTSAKQVKFMERWYVKLSGEVYGPYPITKLKSMKDQSLIGPDSKVCSTSSGTWVSAISDDKVRYIFAANQSSVHNPNEIDPSFRKFFVFGQIQSGVNNEFENVMSRLGEWTQIMPNCWALRSPQPLAFIRNQITPILGVNDSILITDSTSGRSISHNLGLEAEVKLKNLWL